MDTSAEHLPETVCHQVINGISSKCSESHHVAVLDQSAWGGQQMQEGADCYSNTLGCKDRIGL